MSEEKQPKKKPEHPEVYKVIGAPGTGKTTRVVGNPELEDHTSLIQQNLDEYSMEEQMVVTYTKAGTEEAADRLSTILDVTKKMLNERVITIHAKCFRTLGLSRDNVANHYDKKSFCSQYDLDYGWDDDDDDIMAADKAPGNSLMDIYGWLKSNRKDIDEWEDCPSEWTGERDPAWLMKRWDEYKDDNNLYDFSDMIEECVEMARSQVENLGWGFLFNSEEKTDREVFNRARQNSERDPSTVRGMGAFVDTKVLYVDEVQDLTPLQWDWYLAQKLACEKVYIGGDDDQTIYGWAGANPNFMLDEEGDFEVLDTTYRIPREVWQTCDKVIHQVDKRQEKEVTPAGEGGEVKTLNRPSPRQVAKEAEENTVFMLFRARYMIDDYAEKLNSLGIPYDNMSTFDTWDTDTTLARDALAKVHRKEDKINIKELNKLKELAEDEYVKRNNVQSKGDDVLSTFGGAELEDVKNMFEFPGYNVGTDWDMYDYLEHCDELNYYQKEAIKGNIQQGNEYMNPERVKLGTIHSAKGKEAETVILFLDSTQTILGNMAEDTRDRPNKAISDAERRVYYVGMTRASEKLVLVEGGINPEQTIRLNNLVGEGTSSGYGKQAQMQRGGSWE